MRAVIISRPGGPEVLELREVPDPLFGEEEVLVRVRASAMNRADLLQRRGLYPAPPGAPADIPGLEMAGEIEACGARVSLLRPGDRVMAILAGGGHAEKVAVHERLCIPVPPRLGWDGAGAVPEAFLTAFDALFLRGGLEPGETVLLHAAASGVGTAAAQLARAAGARVIGLSRTADKRTRLEELGLDAVLDPALPDLAGRVRASAPGPGGVGLVIDLLGASSWELNLDVLSPRGRLVLVGTMGGSRVEADLSVLMRKRLTVVGTVLRSRPLEEKLALVHDFCPRVLPLLADGTVRPIVDRVFRLDEAAEAHRAMERNESFGKLVLRAG